MKLSTFEEVVRVLDEAGARFISPRASKKACLDHSGTAAQKLDDDVRR